MLCLIIVKGVEQFFVPLAFSISKASTRKRYQSTLDLHILPAFGRERLCDISTVDLQRFVLQKFDNGLGWETCNHLRHLMSKIFSCAKKWGQFGGDNPASGVELPEKTSAREKRVLMPEQVPLLLGRLREPVRTMVLLAVLTGLRVGEILRLALAGPGPRKRRAARRASHLSRPPRHSQNQGKQKNASLAPGSDNRVAGACPRSKYSPKTGLVFATRKGTALSDTNLLWRELKPPARKIGLPWVSWHTFRRTHATLLQLAGGSAKDAQAQLGHSQITTTLGIYTIPLPAHQRAAVEKLSGLVTNGDEFAAGRGTGVTQTQLLQ